MIFTEALVLTKKEKGENDWGYTALTERFGKIEFFSKGGRKSTARLTGHLEPLTLANLELLMNRREKVIGGDAICSFPGVKKNAAALAAGLEIAHFLDGFLPLYYRDQHIFSEAAAYFRKLDGAAHAAEAESQIGRVSAEFFCRLGRVLGVEPLICKEIHFGTMLKLEAESIAVLKNALIRSF